MQIYHKEALSVIALWIPGLAMAENGDDVAMEGVAVKEEEVTKEEVKDEPKDEPMDQEDESERTEDYQKLLDYGIDQKVAAELDDIYKSGNLLTHSSPLPHFYKAILSFRNVVTYRRHFCVLIMKLFHYTIQISF